jgi:hypothetical protein
MVSLYRSESSNPKWNAQRNLCGRTHYVDDETLHWHKSRVLSSRCTDNGLLFAIVTSDALDMNNTKRGFRFVIFDVFGTVLERPNLEGAFRTAAQATKAMWAALNAIDAHKVTQVGAENAEKHFKQEMDELRGTVAALATKAA